MHLLHIPANISEDIPVAFGRPMEPGKSYLATNAFVGSMLQTRWRVMVDEEMWALNILLEAEPYDEDNFNPAKDWNGQSLWLLRGGGWGDLLMLTPLCRELKKRWPLLRVNIACGSQYHELFKGTDITPRQIPVPWPLHAGTAIVSFEESVEGTPDGTRYHIAQLFANKLGIEITDLKPSYKPTYGEMIEAMHQYPIQKGKSRIAVQVLASALYRSYPHIEKVIAGLAKEAEVLLFGTPGQTKLINPIENVTNLMEKRLSFRDSAAALATCDAVVAPDSALVHLSAALDVPCVSLYGPFPASLRVSGDKTAVFQGNAPCAPCFFHAATPTEFPVGMPCSTKGRCVALEDINPDSIVEKALQMAIDRRRISIVHSN